MIATKARTGALLSILALVSLAACGSKQSTDAGAGVESLSAALGQVAQQGVGKLSGKQAPAAQPRSAEQIAAEAARVNKSPLILVTLENLGRTQALALVGQNGNMRTYMNPAEQAVILRSGMLLGTKGLGNDLAVAGADQSAALIRARRAGTAQRTMRFLTGDGLERPLPMSCTVSTGASKSFSFTGQSWNAQQVGERCTTASGLSIDNSYLVTADGQIPVSRQWISPVLGYLTIQTIRP